jgi:hypothetical protein
MTRKQSAAWLLICLLLLPPVAMAGPKNMPHACGMRESRETAPIDREIVISDSVTVLFYRYETGDSFWHSPAGGFSSVVLSAKEGYRLLCLYVGAESENGAGINTAALQNMELLVDGAPTATARSSFFQTRQERQTRNPFQTKNRVSVEGYLVFALPDEALTPDTQLTVLFYYDENEYSCSLGAKADELKDEPDGTLGSSP